MTFSIHGLAVARGIAIGRAVLVASSRVDVAHYFIEPAQIDSEMLRLVHARDAVHGELQTLHDNLPKDSPPELAAILEVHLMLLHDEMLAEGVTHWVKDRLYNAEWALTSQLDVVARQFDEMDDPYLRERKGDLEQVVERLLRHMKGEAHVVPHAPSKRGGQSRQQDLQLEDNMDVPLVLVAHDLSPADMLQFKQSVFAGFVTDVGGKTSHTAIVARSLDIPAVVGARTASQLVRQDDWIIIDGDAGVVIVNPSPIILAEYGFKQRQAEVERERLSRLRHTPAVTLDGQRVELLANIEMPEDSPAALGVGAVGVGLFRSEFLFMGRVGALPDEEEQYQAYRRAIEGMKGLPVTIRTVDIGADKPLDRAHKDESHLNPALGLRAIRWSLADPAMFLTQLRAILRGMRQAGVSILIIDHAVQEVLDVCDRVVVMRHGDLVADRPKAEVTEAELYRLMIGKDRHARTKEAVPLAQGAPVLRAKGLGQGKEYRGIDLALYPRRITAIVGTFGAGREALMRTLFGVEDADQGVIELDGTPVTGWTPRLLFYQVNIVNVIKSVARGRAWRASRGWTPRRRRTSGPGSTTGSPPSDR